MDRRPPIECQTLREGAETIRLSLLIAFVSILLGTGVARAQGYGRWWWESSVGYGQGSYENLLETERVSQFDQQDLRIGFGVNGFIVDPGVGRFHLGVDALISQLEGGRDIDEQRLGGDFSLDLVPRGRTPIRLFFQQRLFDFTNPDPTDPFALYGLPDSSSRWGGQLRVRRGALEGTVLGFEHNSVAFLDSAADDDVQDRQYVEWSRGGAAAQHSFRLERLLRQYGVVGLEVEDLVANLNERLQLGETWNWQLSGTGISRTITREDTEGTDSDSLRLRNRVYHPVRQADLLDLNYNLDLFRTDSSSTAQRHDALVLYRWRASQSWEVAPFVQYVYQPSDDLTLRSPRAGLSLTWSLSRPTWDTTWTSRGSYGKVELSGVEGTADDSNLAVFLAGTMGHGPSDGFRQELAVEMSRNELRAQRQPTEGLPDPLPDGLGLGTEDFARSRATLSRRKGARFLQGWGEWSFRQSTGLGEVEDFEAETVTGTLQVGVSRFSLGSSLGQTSVKQEITGDQEVDSLSVTLGFQPVRPLSLRGSYRSDKRQLLLTPDIDTQRYDLVATIRVLGFIVEGSLFESRESLLTGFERTNRGLIWSIRRRFSGWLPILTGAGPRGTIQ